MSKGNQIEELKQFIIDTESNMKCESRQNVIAQYQAILINLHADLFELETGFKSLHARVKI